MLRKLFLLLVLFSSVVGCSRSPSYKGYVPVTQEEATAFAEQLVERTSQGDVSWYLEICADIDSQAAVYAFAGLDVPIDLKDPTEEFEDFLRDTAHEMNKKIAVCIRELRLLEVKEAGNTYVAFFEFTLEKMNEKTATGDMITSEEHLTFVKKRDTGEIFIAAIGMNL